MWEIDNLSQLLGFLYSAALGGIYCIAYDFLRTLRKEINLSDFSVFITDVMYSLFCAVTCFCFLLAVTGGLPRIFVFAGAAVGFVTIRLTVSRFAAFALTKIIKALKFVLKHISAFFGRFFRSVDTATAVFGEKVKKICVLAPNTLKKHLKKK